LAVSGACSAFPLPLGLQVDQFAGDIPWSPQAFLQLVHQP
jgi:hypothetical protein